MSTEPHQTPAITVVVPALNAGEYLPRSLAAIFASRGPSYECIVVDDGSTDDSASIARQSGARIIHVSDGPLGPAHARNRGAEAARGSIIFFVDADVVLAPGALRRVATLFQERTDVAAVFGSYDNHPAAAGVVSFYRNLLNHFVHQNGNREASTFWEGCGAISESSSRRAAVSMNNVFRGLRSKISSSAIACAKAVIGSCWTRDFKGLT